MAIRIVCALAAVAGAVLSGAPENSPEAVIRTFGNFPYGGGPHSALARDPQGNFYGTASAGGNTNLGVVFKLDTSGNYTVLHSFVGGTDGSKPFAPITIGPAGSLFGTTPSGGAHNRGVVYELDSSGNETVLYAFTGGSDGGDPQSGVFADLKGNLYGTTASGGADDLGVVYKLSPQGQETVLFSFTGGYTGAHPAAGVVQDSAGNLYGTTVSGGTPTRLAPEGCGLVYEIDPSGQETVLYTFSCGNDGAVPTGGVILDPSHNLYGTTKQGGVGYGVIYKLAPSGKQTVLYNFTGGSEGGGPVSGVTRDESGNLYGATEWAASTVGTVYELDTSGSLHVLATLQVFQGNVSPPYAIPVPTLDESGNIYGAAPYNSPGGILYKIDAQGQQTTLYDFAPAPGGTTPWAGLARDASGDLFGTTADGGTSNAGVVFKIDAAGNETVLHSFTVTDGANPMAGVVLDSAGNLFGTTSIGGAYGCGTVFELDPAGYVTVLHSFAGGDDGCNPYAGVTLDANGNLYGTTKFGGGTQRDCFTNTCGTVYKVTASGNETVLYSFTGGTDGAWPEGGVVLDAGGNLYGTTGGGGPDVGGVVFKLDPSGKETVLYAFTEEGNGGGGPTGAYPSGNLALDSNGNVYGTAWAGGTTSSECQGYGCGVVFQIGASGQYTMLYSFTGGAGGGMPNGIVRDPAGNLYGTTQYGGRPESTCPEGLSEGCGVVFKVDPSGTETVLYRFTGGADGAYPYAGVTIDPAGYLSGTTQAGGLPGGGVVFMLTLHQ